MSESRTRLVAAVLFALVLALPTSARAAGQVLLVPAEFPTITLALASALSGDTILVSAGVYPECLTISGLTELDLIGKKGAIIDASGCGIAITIVDGSLVTVKGLAITGADPQGVQVQPGASEVLLTKLRIEDDAPTPVLSVLEVGVSIDGASLVTLDDVDIKGASVHAVEVKSATGTVVKRCYVRDGIGDGINVDLGTGVKLDKNVIKGLLGPAVRFFHLGGSGVTGGGIESLVTKNKVLVSPGGGIVIGGANNLIEKNTIIDSGATGIEALANGGGSIYRKNKVTGATVASIIVGGTDDTFEKNSVKLSHGDGIVVNGPTNLLLGNKVIEPAGHGYVVALTAIDNDFTTCSSVKAGGDGFHVEGTFNTFTKSSAAGSAGLDLNDAAGALTTNVYTDCKFKTSNVP